MRNVHAGFLLLIGAALLIIGNYLADYGPLASLIGTGMGLFGDLLLLYSVFRGIRWVFKKAKAGKKQPGSPS